MRHTPRGSSPTDVTNYSEEGLLAGAIHRLEERLETLRNKVSTAFDLTGKNITAVLDTHAALYYDVVLLYVDSQRNLKNAELSVKELKATVAVELRKAREEAGLKSTEALMLELVDSDSRCSEARGLRTRAQLCQEELQLTLSTFEHRRSMINNKVSMGALTVDKANADANVNTASRGRRGNR